MDKFYVINVIIISECFCFKLQIVHWYTKDIIIRRMNFKKRDTKLLIETKLNQIKDIRLRSQTEVGIIFR